MRNDQLLARGLGAFSVALGAAQLAAPRRFSRAVGGRGDAGEANVARLVGAREVTAGVGLLVAKRPVPWAWARVGGDLVDIAILGAALAHPARRRDRLAAAIAAVVGITGLDALTATSLVRRADPQGGRPLDDDAVGVRRAITIRHPRAGVYAFWRELSNLPRFMTHLESVEELGDGRSRWTAQAPGGTTVTWEAQLTEDRPDELIAWRSVDGSQVANAGRVRFVDAPAGRGTEVHVEMEYAPPGGVLGSTLAKLTGQEPAQQVAEDLRHLKQVLELGSIVRSDGVLEGRRLRQRPAQPIDSSAS
jgi:uncharacterized membrane protein